MKALLKDMTPIEWAGAAMIAGLLSVFAVSFCYFIYAVISGDADLANASYGVAEGLAQ